MLDLIASVLISRTEIKDPACIQRAHQARVTARKSPHARAKAGANAVWQKSVKACPVIRAASMLMITATIGSQLVGCADLNAPKDITAGNPQPSAAQSAMVNCVNSGGQWAHADEGKGFCSYTNGAAGK
jgi:hypothetical protein